MNNRQKFGGTTLVEVIVATSLFVSMVGLITLSLAAVFEGYAFVQRRSSIEQDGQYILARIRYASSQQDSQVVISQYGQQELNQEGATLTHLIPTSQNAGGIALEDGFMNGEYISPIFRIDDAVGADKFIANALRPAGSNTTYQVALGNPIDSSCANTPFVFVGHDGTSDTYFDADYFVIPKNQDGLGFENPAACLRYKIIMSKSGAETPIIYGITIKK